MDTRTYKFVSPAPPRPALRTVQMPARSGFTPPFPFRKNTMKFTLSAFALAIAAPAAFAQPPVTISALVALDGQYPPGHAKQVLVTSGGQSGSRIGFKGTEDLGSG